MKIRLVVFAFRQTDNQTNWVNKASGKQKGSEVAQSMENKSGQNPVGGITQWNLPSFVSGLISMWAMTNRCPAFSVNMTTDEYTSAKAVILFVHRLNECDFLPQGVIFFWGTKSCQTHDRFLTDTQPLRYDSETVAPKHKIPGSVGLDNIVWWREVDIAIHSNWDYWRFGSFSTDSGTMVYFSPFQSLMSQNCCGWIMECSGWVLGSNCVFRCFTLSRFAVKWNWILQFPVSLLFCCRNTKTYSAVMSRTKRSPESLQLRPHYGENPTSKFCEVCANLLSRPPDLVFSISLFLFLISLHSHYHKHTADGASVPLSKSQSLGRSPVRRSFSPFALASRVTSAFWRRVCFCMFPPLIGLNDFRVRIKTRHSRLPPLKLVTWESIFKTCLKLEVCPPETL